MNIHEETLKIARNLIKKDPSLTDWVISKFPELKESEDEKIRKDIISHLQYLGKYCQESMSNVNEWIAWLEKIGKQKPYGQRQECVDCQFNYAGECKGSCAMKRGKQKPTEWSEKDEKMSRFIGNAITADDASIYLKSKGIQVIDVHVWLNELKERVLPQPKQEWSEVDELKRSTLIQVVKKQQGSAIFEGLLPEELIDWLESLKDRVQPKQEWSEEDENNILFLTSIIEECFKDKEKITLCGDTVCANFTKDDVINRLKSLKDRHTLKPSDEQMNVLNEVLNFAANHESPYWNDYIFGTLSYLIRQLKKLKA